MTAIPSSGAPVIPTCWDATCWKRGLRSPTLMAFGTGWSKTWDANALIIRYLASRNHDASAPYGGDMKAALAKIQAKVLLLTSQTDRTIPAYLSRELYAGIKNAQYIEIPTIRGHLGGAAPAKVRLRRPISRVTFVRSSTDCERQRNKCASDRPDRTIDPGHFQPGRNRIPRVMPGGAKVRAAESTSEDNEELTEETNGFRYRPANGRRIPGRSPRKPRSSASPMLGSTTHRC